LDLDDAKDVALEQYMEHLFKHKHCIPSVSKRLADIARLSIAEMRRQLEACEGRKIYSAYIAVTLKLPNSILWQIQHSKHQLPASKSI
jgi:hypothetical protein